MDRCLQARRFLLEDSLLFLCLRRSAPIWSAELAVVLVAKKG
jgi:hypothetical protein